MTVLLPTLHAAYSRCQSSVSLLSYSQTRASDPVFSRSSPEDVVVTRQLVEAGKLLGVEVLDHLVIGHGRWVSLRERRLGFTS